MFGFRKTHVLHPGEPDAIAGLWLVCHSVQKILEMFYDYARNKLGISVKPSKLPKQPAIILQIPRCTGRARKER
jgi:hypothetical protein